MQFLVLYTVTDEINLIILYFLQVILVTIVIVNYQLLYPKASRLVTNNMCMLLMVGFIMLTRLSYEKAIRQYAIAICASVITIVIPVLIRKVRSLRRLTWLYAMIGIVGLAAVTIFGSTSYGAKISVTIGGLFSIQPSEFVKFYLYFFVAGMLYKNTDFKISLYHNDRGGSACADLSCVERSWRCVDLFLAHLSGHALCCNQKTCFYFCRWSAGRMYCCSSCIWTVFAHVRVRVVAWRDPLSVIDNEGYQICQSLFANRNRRLVWKRDCIRGRRIRYRLLSRILFFLQYQKELGGIFANLSDHGVQSAAF